MPPKARSDIPATLHHVLGRGRESGINEVELRSGSRRTAVSELEIPMAEIARQVWVGATGVAMAIKEINVRS